MLISCLINQLGPGGAILQRRPLRVNLSSQAFYLLASLADEPTIRQARSADWPAGGRLVTLR